MTETTAEIDTTPFTGKEGVRLGHPNNEEKHALKLQAEVAVRKARDDARIAGTKHDGIRHHAGLLKISRELAKQKFSGQLTPDEEEKAFQMNMRGASARAMRRGCNHACLKYMRARFYAGEGMNMLVMKEATQDGCEAVFRISDMARALFWKYRKPGFLGVELADEHLNFSVKRVDNDLECNPEIVALLKCYLAELLRSGIFDENPEVVKKVHRERVDKHFRVATVMAKNEEVLKRMDELANQLTDVLANQEALAQRLDTLEKTI
jgi:hypothetical protein